MDPIVRGVLWSGAGEGDRQAIAERMRAHFEPMPAMEWKNVERLEDLTPAIELYVSLIRLGRFDEAFQVFRDRLSGATPYRLSASRQRVELLEMLFPDGVEHAPHLQRPGDQGDALNRIALSLEFAGQPGRAVSCYRRATAEAESRGDTQNLATSLENMSDALRQAGALQAAEASAFRALGLARAEANEFQQAVSLYWMGSSRAARGLADGDVALHRSTRIRRDRFDKGGVGRISGKLAQSALWRGEAAAARRLADRAWELAAVHRHERDFIDAARLQ
jgi:tetratricopeptide (TPR) repeat protein